MQKAKSSDSGCCSHDAHHEHSHENHNHNHDHDHGHDHDNGDFNLNQELVLIISVVVLFIGGLIFEEKLHNTPYSIGEYLVFIPAYLLSGWNVLTSAGRNILRGRVFDENFLMTIATLGALAIHKLPEAVGVMLFFKIGELFQEFAVGRFPSIDPIAFRNSPRQRQPQGKWRHQKSFARNRTVGDIILVKPGEKIPLDGEIIDGNSQIDTSALTGESVPRKVKAGETVLAGTINQTALLTVKVTKLFGESSISRILELVENARSKKAETEKFITKFASYYTPFVVFASLAVALIPPLFISGATNADRFLWVYRALVLLVISCPCGLVISIPLGYFGGIGGAAKRGILVKGSTFLDTLTAVKTVVVDKTGTLTKGVFKVAKIVPHNGLSQSELMAIAAKVESQSNHPVAKSILEAYGGKIDSSDVKDYEEIAGHGIRAKVNNQIVLAGNDRLLHRENIPHDVCNAEGTDRAFSGRQPLRWLHFNC